jgi:polyhydroxyalkanoate synthesis regulator phasin
MKMTVDIDLDGIWFEDGELSTQIQKALMQDLKQQILASLAQDVKNQMADEVRSVVHEVFTEIIQAQLNKILVEDNIPVRGGKSLRELIEEKFTSSGWSSPEEQIKKLASRFGAEMKSRYDLMFATQLVANMSNHGLLKDEMSKLILPQKP